MEDKNCCPHYDEDADKGILGALSAGFAAGVAATLVAVKLLKGLLEK